MPDYIFHIEIGDEILNGLKREIREVLENNYTIYALGLNGPDLFFYRAFFPGLKGKISRILAPLLHKEKFSSFSFHTSELVKLCEDKLLKDKTFTYFTAFIIHLFTDLYFHPYIRYKTILYSKKDSSSWIHKKVEMSLDYAYVFYKRGEFSSFYYLEKIKAVRDFPNEVGRIFANAIITTYNIGFSDKEIMATIGGAYRYTVNILSFFEKRDLLRCYILFPLVFSFLSRGKYINFLTHPSMEEYDDILNLKHSEWMHPELNRTFTFSVLDIVDTFLPFIRELVEKVYRFIYENGPYPEEFKKDYSFFHGIIYGKEIDSNEKISWIY